jgi:hypothetical protein
MQQLLGRGAYLPFIRDHVVQAQYFKDPLRLPEYLASNPFLPDINNERGPDGRNPLYGTNLASLERLVLYRFTKDDTGECHQRALPSARPLPLIIPSCRSPAAALRYCTTLKGVGYWPRVFAVPFHGTRRHRVAACCRYPR